MKTVGFPISHKENENRRAVIPPDIGKIKHPEALCFEEGYGEVMGFSDSDYRAVGAHTAARKEVSVIRRSETLNISANLRIRLCSDGYTPYRTERSPTDSSAGASRHMRGRICHIKAGIYSGGTTNLRERPQSCTPFNATEGCLMRQRSR